MSAPRLLLAPALAILVAGVACGESTGTDFESCPPETVLAVTAGTTPEFSWIPECAVDMLWVAPWPEGEPEPVAADGIFNVWSGEEALRPPVRYGELPPGMFSQLSGEPPALEAGQRYQVWIAHQLRHGGVIARATFTP